MKRAFVTGGSGFVGQYLIRKLRENKITVHALVRSEKSEKIVKQLGAIPFKGDLSDKNILARSMLGCDVIFHLAGLTIVKGGTQDEFYKANVIGTENVLSAAKKSVVKKFIFISSEAVLLDKRRVINADETWPIAKNPFGPYANTKVQAEKKVLNANSRQLNTIIIRPRLIWGKESKGIKTIIDNARKGKIIFINQGRFLTSTCHVKNACEALVLAAEKGKGGEIYFISDEKPIELRTFVNTILKAKNIPPINKSIPRWLAWSVAFIAEMAWRTLRIKSKLPFTRITVRILGEEITVNDTKARNELGYAGTISMNQGFEEFKE